MGGLRRLPSGRWVDTNGNSYSDPREAAEAEAHSRMNPKASTRKEPPEY